MIMKIIKKIKKIIEYIPILLKDEDWDYSSLLTLIQYKVSRMKKCIKENDYIIEEQINNICESIDKTINDIDNYFNAYELFEKEYGDIYEELGLEHKWVKLDNGNSRMATVYKNTDVEIKPRHEAKIKKHINKQLEYEQNLWNNIWDGIKLNGQKWWD